MIETKEMEKMSASLFVEIREMVEATRRNLAHSINSELTQLNWRIGNRIGNEMLGGDRGEYGERILVSLSQELTREFGRGFSYSSLTRMIKLSQVFPDFEIVATLSQQLSWSHFQTILPFENQLKREFYAEMCRLERWSVRTLRAKIDSMLYERTGISRKPAELAQKEINGLRDDDRLTPALVFRDPLPSYRRGRFLSRNCGQRWTRHELSWLRVAVTMRVGKTHDPKSTSSSCHPEPVRHSFSDGGKPHWRSRANQKRRRANQSEDPQGPQSTRCRNKSSELDFSDRVDEHGFSRAQSTNDKRTNQIQRAGFFRPRRPAVAWLWRGKRARL